MEKTKMVETKVDTAEQTEISWKSAIKVADRVELQTVKLLECDCKQTATCPDGKKAFNIEDTVQTEIDKEHNNIGVFIKFALKAFGEGVEQKKENSFLGIEATFLLLYNINNMEGLDDGAFHSFAELNGTYNAWPYWREFVQSVTSRMQLPPLTIPVFRISQKTTTDKKKEDVVKT
jgi:preprotein translocase subunit SecB